MFGLTMIKEYLDELLDGVKTYDARSYPTNKRGVIALVDSRTMRVYGVIELVGIRKITPEEYAKWHCTGKFKGMEFLIDSSKEYYAYEFVNPRKLVNPIKLNVAKKTWVEIDVAIQESFYFENRLF